MKNVFFENIWGRVVPWLLLLVVTGLGLALSSFYSNRVIQIVIGLVCTLVAVCLARALVVKPPIVVFGESSLSVRGVKPGRWKLFQCWKTERIEDRDIVSIKIGHLKNESSGLIAIPPGEPSRNARFQVFLWITYLKHGDKYDLYYPHLKNIHNFSGLVATLKARYGALVEENK